VRALILDCDGVIAETERELHLPAFNQAFREFGLRLRWTSEEYGERLRIAGGKERVLASLTHPDTRALGLSDSPEARRELVERVHRRKTEIVAEMLGRQPPPPRAGVRRLTTAAHAAGWRLAVASTSTEDSVRRVVESVIGRELAGHVLFLAGDVVTAKKPDPEIYELALARLGATPAEAIVVEDSAIGLHAARALEPWRPRPAHDGDLQPIGVQPRVRALARRPRGAPARQRGVEELNPRCGRASDTLQVTFGRLCRELGEPQVIEAVTNVDDRTRDPL
jgi:HAD superfamily hydrolase (TIGR01509 family)